jgi:hypothetical protein
MNDTMVPASELSEIIKNYNVQISMNHCLEILDELMIKNEGLDKKIEAQNLQLLSLQKANIELTTGSKELQKKVSKLESTVDVFKQDLSFAKVELNPEQQEFMKKRAEAKTNIEQQVD